MKHLLARYEHARGPARRRDLRGGPQNAVRCASVIRRGCINEKPVPGCNGSRAQGSVLEVSLSIENKSRETWTPESLSLGWQFFDPQSNLFIEEGAWTPVAAMFRRVRPRNLKSRSRFRPEAGAYEIYVSHIQPSGGWAYARGERVPEDSGERRRRPDSDPGARDHHGTLAALAANLGCASQTVRKPAADRRPEPSPDPIHGASRYSGALSRVFWRRLLDGPQSAAADGDVLLRLRHRAAHALRRRPEPHRFRALFSRRDAALARILRARGPRGVRDSGAPQFRQETGVSARHVAGESGGLRVGNRTFRRRRLRRGIAHHSPYASRQRCFGCPCC